MTVYIDKKFVEFVSSSLDKFSWKKDNLANCRCPLCGDSQKNKNKCRGFFYEREGSYYYKCHNCAASLSLYSFLEQHAPALKTEYQLERYREKTERKPRPRPVKIKATGVEEMFRKKYKEVVDTRWLIPIKDLDESHAARQFVINRKIPKDKHDLLYYCKNFGSFTKQLTGQTNLYGGGEDRIVLPFFNKEGKMVAAQGRALAMQSVHGNVDDNRQTRKTRELLRYITIKSSDAPDKLWFGQWRVNPKKKIYIVEGPIDSLFIKNCIAMVGASGVDNIPPHLQNSEGVYVLDNEPRNKEICNLNEKLIDLGKNVCIWPSDVTQKDPNDMIMAGYTRREIKKIIDENTCSGLVAKHRLNQWNRI